MKSVISFSRRSDGPAYFMDRLETAIEREYIDVQNPINRKIYRVSLSPSDVAGFVFWSKNFKKLLGNWKILLKYAKTDIFSPNINIPVYFQFTRNSVEKRLEPHTPSLDESYAQLNELIELTSPDHVMWRFDPIVFWEDAGSIQNNMVDFEEIASHFADAGVRKCTISFATYYKKVQQRMRRQDFSYHEPNSKEIIDAAGYLLKIASKHDIKIFACCNPLLLQIPGILQAHCIDGEFLGKLWGARLSKARDTGQRETCGCTRSRDIGGYGKEWECPSSCLYCYANPKTRI
ncbi:MAG: DUF1848 family protein [Promethearchaeota archaeon]